MNAFDAIDFNTQQGDEIKRMLEKWLHQKREQNDNTQLSAADTLVLRGEISMIKRLLQKEPPVVKAPNYNTDIYGGGNKQ